MSAHKTAVYIQTPNKYMINQTSKILLDYT